MSRRPRSPFAEPEEAREPKDAWKARILGFVEEHDWVTFARLHKHFAGDAREDTEIVLPGNRVVWAGLPRPIVDALLELLDEARLAAIPGSKAAYRRDGRVLKLPVEKTPPPHGAPHWLPVMLRPMAAVRAEEADAANATAGSEEP